MNSDIKQSKSMGEWESSLDAEAIAAGSRRFGLVFATDNHTYWTESRPEEGGRNVIMRSDTSGQVEDVLAKEYSARSQVHEYGGGEFLITNDGLFFVNDEDQDIYFRDEQGGVQRVTREPQTRFADFAWDPNRSHIIAVAEVHAENEAHAQPENKLVCVSFNPETGAASPLKTLFAETDFCAFPQLDRTGRKLAWIGWDLPAMPWESAALFLASISDSGELEGMRRIEPEVAGAQFQPAWSDDGELYVISDHSGWGNLYRINDATFQLVHQVEGEFARPIWNLGCRSYGIGRDNVLYSACLRDGGVRLVRLEGNQMSSITDKNTFTSFENVSVSGNDIAGVATSGEHGPAIVRVTDGPDLGINICRYASQETLDSDDISQGDPIKFDNEQGDPVFGLFYGPRNSRYSVSDSELPPAIITLHGGPTGFGERGLNLNFQYWTNRGFAVFDIDYSGSFGYGRAYRQRLDGNWGVRDVQDTICGARYLVDRGLAADGKIFVSGGSAGGLTALLALAQSDFFAGGAIRYGVADLNSLAQITHKFESGYLYSLLGVKSGEASSVFDERSPVRQVHGIKSPVILFQGLDDFVVPPEQSRDMVRALVSNNVPVAYKEFQGEGHGFRQFDTLVDTLKHENAFFTHVLDLKPDEPLPDMSALMNRTADGYGAA
ncbi:MAG: alpha/beta hydrolase family protein [Methyloligellaceae bacterium]